MTSFDALVIGGGHNGLVAAALLAKGGRRVALVEAAAEFGGAARTEEFAPGFRASSFAHILNRLHPDVIAALDLHKHGFEPGTIIPTVSLATDGNHLTLEGAYGEALVGATPAETTAWTALRAQLLRFTSILKPMLARRPPDLSGLSFADGAALGLTALSLRRLGKEDMRDFLRMLLMNVEDVLDEHLADDRLRGLLAFDAVLGAHLGPRSPTSLLGLYYRLSGEIGGLPGAQAVPKGGMGAVVAALVAAATAAGVSLRADAPVRSVLVEKGRAVGLVLGNGDELRAPVIVSAINPRTTFLDLVGPRELDTGFVRKVNNIRMKGSVARLHLALDGLPPFTGLETGQLQARLVIAPSSNHVERAFNPSKYGELSPEPVMEITLPSLADPSLAPTGGCVLTAVVQYAPYALKEGWDTGKPKLLKAILAQLEVYAPGIGAKIRHADLLTPQDIEQHYRMPGGHWHHGEFQVDQMLVSRPVPGAAGYGTPIEGLYLAGAGSHPGGGVSGVPGLNAARHILARKSP